MAERCVIELSYFCRIDFVVHGDDPCLVDGKDVYETAQKLGTCVPAKEYYYILSAIQFVEIERNPHMLSRSDHEGKYLTIPRTEGISTTAIVGRILYHLQNSCSDGGAGAEVGVEAGSSSSASRNSDTIASLFHGKSSFLTTGSVIRLFSENIKWAAG